MLEVLFLSYIKCCFTSTAAAVAPTAKPELLGLLRLRGNMCLDLSPEANRNPLTTSGPCERPPRATRQGHGNSQAHMQHAPHARTGASPTVAWPPALRRPHLPPHLPVKVSPVPLRAKVDYSVPTGDCVTSTHAQTRAWGHAGSRSKRHDPLATSHHSSLSKCPFRAVGARVD